MILSLLAYIILASTSVPTPPPTWENLIPWLFGFFASLVSGFAYYIMYQQGKRLDNIEVGQKEIKEAIYASNKVRLLQLAADTSQHPIIKEQVDIAIRETEEALRIKR